MKRLMTILALAAVISSLLIACGTAGPKIYDDPGQTISVKVDQEFIIALEANPTTGYTWQEEFDESFVMVVGGGYESSSEAKGGLVGAGGIQSWQFKALKKGKTEVTMVYKQPWKGGGVGETKVFTVSIKCDDSFYPLMEAEFINRLLLEVANGSIFGIKAGLCIETEKAT